MQKQTLDEPLFPDLIWSRPQNKRLAGKLLIVGGNLHSFTAPAKAFTSAKNAGVGSIKVALPQSAKRILGTSFAEAEFLPDTPSGSFATSSLAPLIDLAGWADGVLFAGDLGKNSETAVLLEKFVTRYKGLITLAGDCLDYFLQTDSPMLSRPTTLSVGELSKLQKMAKAARLAAPLQSSMDLSRLAEVLNGWTEEASVGFLTEHSGQFVVSYEGMTSITPAQNTGDWRTELPAYAAVWAVQQPGKLFEGLSTAVFDYLS